MKGKVSIVIPAFNAEKDIKNCLNSVLKQNYQNIEIVVVDDGSTDNTYHIAKEYEKIIVLKNRKKGVSSARNYGIRHCTGEYITFVDADDLVAPTFISELVNLLTYYDCDCAAVAYTTDVHKWDRTYTKSVLLFNDDEKHMLLTGVNNGADGYVWNKIYKMSIIKKYSLLFDESITVGEDLLFNNSYFKVSHNLVFLNKTLYFYKLNSSSSVNKLDNSKWFDFIDVYLELLDGNLSEKVITILKFNFIQIILEAFYRKKYCNDAKYSEDELITLKKRYVRLEKDFTIKQKIKIILFMLFPNGSMKYKRRMIKD